MWALVYACVEKRRIFKCFILCKKDSVKLNGMCMYWIFLLWLSAFCCQSRLYYLVIHYLQPFIYHNCDYMANANMPLTCIDLWYYFVCISLIKMSTSIKYSRKILWNSQHTSWIVGLCHFRLKAQERRQKKDNFIQTHFWIT